MAAVKPSDCLDCKRTLPSNLLLYGKVLLAALTKGDDEAARIIDEGMEEEHAQH